jgi:rhodanese-related sulfurtransferase
VLEKLKAGEKITFIDVRPTVVFANGHIPGAISVPSALVPAKQLPPLGHAIVYDDGLIENTAQAAAEALNQKKGITAEVLDGGFAAWETAHASTTRPRGMRAEELPLISYDRLKQTPAEKVVLVDLRKQPAPARQNAVAGATNNPALPLTDLGKEFPGMCVSQSAFNLPATRQAAVAGADASQLLVLIDSNDGAAQKMARTLKANGIKRFVILVGGEEILARHGQPGLQRASSTIIMRKPVAAPSPNTTR